MDTNCLFVAKSYTVFFDIQEKDQESIITMIKECSKIRYPTILPAGYFDLFNQENKFSPTFYTKYFQQGSLEDLLKKNDPTILTDTNKFIILLGISLAMNHLHHRNIIHGNLKASNILLDENLYPKIIDFNFFTQSDDKSTIYYDIFCFGHLCYEIFTSKRSPIQISELENRYLLDLIMSCISENLTDRPTFSELLCLLNDSTYLFKDLDSNKVIEFLNLFKDDYEADVWKIYFLNKMKDKIKNENDLSLLENAAENGCTNAMIKLADVIINDDKNRALEYYKRAIDKGDRNAMYRYYENDEDENNIYLKKAADCGHFDALECYICELKDETSKTEPYIKRLADRGHLEYILSYISINEPKDINQAVKYIYKAIEANEQEGIKKCKRVLFGDYNNEYKEKVAKVLQTVADKGNINVMIAYADCLLNDKQNDFYDKEEGLKYYKKAIEKGSIKAMYNYATKIEDENIDEAIKYYQIGIEKGDPSSMVRYSNLLLEGEKVPDDKVRSIELLKMAIDHGDAESMYLYAQMLYEGKELPADINEAAKYYRMAAVKEHYKAKRKYSQMVLSHEIEVDDNEFYNSAYAGYLIDMPQALFEFGKLVIKGKCFWLTAEGGKELIKKAASMGYPEALSYVQFENAKYNNNEFKRFDQEAKQYKQILLDYKEDNSNVFVDKNFLPMDNWVRVDELYEAPLFQVDLIDVDFVKQGKIGDCYFISALSRVAHQPYLIKELFNHSYPDKILGKVKNSINIKCGAVVVYFYAFGRRTPVLIDTLIPAVDNEPIFSCPKDKTKSPWFCLVEKAYAKLRGSYSTIVSGYFGQSMYSLFFYYNNYKKFQEIPDKKSIFEKIMKYQKKGFVIGISTSESDNNHVLKEKGLVKKHCYLLLKAREIDGKRFVCLHNPWCEKEWNGDYSRNSDLLTPEIKKVIDYNKAKKGTFWMIEKDFLKYFCSMDVSKPIHPQWTMKVIYDQLNFKNDISDLSKIKMFAFQVTEEIPADKEYRIHFLIEACEPFFYQNFGQISFSYFTVFSRENGNKISDKSIENKCILCSNKIQSFSRVFKGNEIITFCFIPKNWNGDSFLDLYANIFCSYKFKLYCVDDPEDPFPDSTNPGLVFENYTLSNPSISNQLTMDVLNKKIVFTFDSLPLCTNEDRNSYIAKIFQYHNKYIGSSFFVLKDDFEETASFLGSGSNGGVLKVKEKKTNEIYAAKIFNRQINIMSKEFFVEWQILQSLKYPSIVEFKGISDRDFNGDKKPVLIIEYCKEGSLYDFMQKVYQHYDESVRKEYRIKWNSTMKMINLIGIALGMKYLHNHDIIHRDLKFNNILLDDDLQPKICDFDHSKLLKFDANDHNSLNVGTLMYMAPEIQSSSTYSFPVDAYSFGVISYYIYTDQFPEKPIDDVQLKKLPRFVSKLLSKDPSERPTFDQIVDTFLRDKEGTWIEGADENEVKKYLHKFGRSLKFISHSISNVNLDIIRYLTEDDYPQIARHPKKSIVQIIQDESIPEYLRDLIETTENVFNTVNQSEYLEEDEVVNAFLFDLGIKFQCGDEMGIQKDYFYAIRYLRGAALLGNSYAVYALALIFLNFKGSDQLVFKMLSIAADLGVIDAYEMIGILYGIGKCVDKNIVMSSINFKIAADKGKVESMIHYARNLMQICLKQIDENEFKMQLEKAKVIINDMEEKSSFVYKEIRLVLEVIENEEAAAFVCEKYYIKAAEFGSEEAKQMLQEIDSFIQSNNDDYPTYFDELGLSPSLSVE